MSGTEPQIAVLPAEPAALQWARRACLLGLTALAVWLAVRIVMGWLAPSSLWQPVTLPTMATQTSAASASYDFSTDPFSLGEADVAAPEVEPDSDAPETTLNLVLTGTRAGPNGTGIIRTPDNRTDNYYVDQIVTNGVTLRGVFPKYVLLDVNGQVQRLTLEDAKIAQRAGTAQVPAKRSLSTVRALDMSTLIQQVQLVPAHDESGTVLGVYARPRSAAVKLADYGLRDTDIITRAAGSSLSRGIPDVSAIMRAASSGRPVPVEIIRDGQPMTLSIGASS